MEDLCDGGFKIRAIALHGETPVALHDETLYCGMRREFHRGVRRAIFVVYVSLVRLRIGKFADISQSVTESVALVPRRQEAEYAVSCPRVKKGTAEGVGMRCRGIEGGVGIIATLSTLLLVVNHDCGQLHVCWRNE